MFIDWIVCSPPALKRYAKALTDNNDELVERLQGSEIVASHTTVGLFPEDLFAIYRGFGGDQLDFKDMFRERVARVHGTLAFFAELPSEFGKELASTKVDNGVLHAVRGEMKRIALVAAVPAVRRNPKTAEARAQMVSVEMLAKLKEFSTIALEGGGKRRLYCYIVAQALGEPE